MDVDASGPAAVRPANANANASAPAAVLPVGGSFDDAMDCLARFIAEELTAPADVELTTPRADVELGTPQSTPPPTPREMVRRPPREVKLDLAAPLLREPTPVGDATPRSTFSDDESTAPRPRPLRLPPPPAPLARAMSALTRAAPEAPDVQTLLARKEELLAKKEELEAKKEEIKDECEDSDPVVHPGVAWAAPFKKSIQTWVDQAGDTDSDKAEPPPPPPLPLAEEHRYLQGGSERKSVV